MSWSGNRRMLFNNKNTMELERILEKVAEIVIQSQFTTQPPWCKFEGIFCGTFPGTLEYASVLNITLNDRNLNGTLPINFKDFRSIKYLDLATNSLYGTLTGMDSWSPKLTVINLNNNRFSGKLPQMIKYQMNDLSIFTVSSNILTGSIPQSLNYLSKLSILQLSYNSFSGNLYNASLSSTILNTLSFAGNVITGSFPYILTNLTSLRSLDLSKNYLAGTIPANLGNYGVLNRLDLSLNSMSGTIPTSVSKLNLLSYLDLHNNYFTMGTLKNITSSYFSLYTSNNTINLSENCLVFINKIQSSTNANRTRCKAPSFQPSSSEFILLIFPSFVLLCVNYSVA